MVAKILPTTEKVVAIAVTAAWTATLECSPVPIPTSRLHHVQAG